MPKKSKKQLNDELMNALFGHMLATTSNNLYAHILAGSGRVEELIEYVLNDTQRIVEEKQNKQ